MDALVMCGGRGTRLGADVEKPLYEVGGRPMVDRVRAALAGSRVGTVHAVVSPATPRTREHLAGACPVVEAPGDGYVSDLQHALTRVDPPVLTAAADLPLLTAGVVDAVLDAHAGGSLAVHVPVAVKRRAGASVDATVEGEGRPLAPAGVNVVSTEGPDRRATLADVRLAVNVNRPRDALVAEALLRAGEGRERELERDPKQKREREASDGAA